MILKPGDKVITSKYMGTEVKIDGEQLTIVKQSDVVAIAKSCFSWFIKSVSALKASSVDNLSDVTSACLLEDTGVCFEDASSEDA